ncbi:TetR/AcrR family transcriptional regulator [Mucilaginibacter aquaedulcis]|uniref:TetR/AcrR family transcriptional regulator n=1 Tax=Mucilaginibacter aquaedulcis TaxID=1187081 RepID=UPI0025B502D2|nr:TetR/AcrR family transcriptional regulator [Mucilaginibacter aquaedulcis]MDN3548869.1 TetR/AcrR family transcriptional regulator [Mucilaginibacter aquaedulcis]
MKTQQHQLSMESDIKLKILRAAMQIVREAGWNALSMRKIAVMINCTPPAIYGYFSSKEAIRLGLARWGFLRLNQSIERARDTSTVAIDQLERMWSAYIVFAQEERMLYQIMFGHGMVESPESEKCTEADMITLTICEVIGNVPKGWNNNSEIIRRKYYLMWAMAHGASMIRQRCSPIMETSLSEWVAEWVRLSISDTD